MENQIIFANFSMFMILLQCAVIYYSYRIYVLLNGKWGFLLTVGFFLMLVRRVVATATSNYSTMDFMQFFDKLILPLAITICILIGLMKIHASAKVTYEANKNKSDHLEKLRDLTENLNDNGR